MGVWAWDWKLMEMKDSFFERCRDLWFELKFVQVWATLRSALGSFARAIASLDCPSSVLVLLDSCSRLWDNRANEGEVCGVGSGDSFLLMSGRGHLYYCLAFGLL